MEEVKRVKKKIEKIKEEQEKLGKEIKEKTMGYILAALGFVVGLAWNDAIKSVIEYVFPLDKNSIFAKVSYAFLVTIIVVLVTAYVIKSNEEKKS
jgi:septation ring formation regulator EzrA